MSSYQQMINPCDVVLLGERGQNPAHRLHADVHLALLDGPDPALVVQVAWQRVEGVGQHRLVGDLLRGHVTGEISRWILQDRHVTGHPLITVRQKDTILLKVNLTNLFRMSSWWSFSKNWKSGNLITVIKQLSFVSKCNTYMYINGYQTGIWRMYSQV